MASTFREKIGRDEPVLAMGLAQARTVDVVLMTAACGYDAIWVDLEHNATSLETASLLCTTALVAGLTPFVRVPSHDSQYMSRALDTGAQGIVVPHVDTVEEAERIVATCKFPPAGRRSMIGAHALSRYQSMSFKDVAELANRETIVSVMLETPEAIDRADAIAAVQGLDMLLIGPVDLTMEMGILGEFRHDRFLHAVKHTASACRRHGKTFGIAGITDPVQLAELFAMGLRFANIGSDVTFMMAAATEKIAKVRAAAGSSTAPGGSAPAY